VAAHRFDFVGDDGQTGPGAASVDQRSSRSDWHEPGNGSGADSDRVLLLEAETERRASRGVEVLETEALRDEIARLRIMLRHLKRDVAVKDEYVAAMRTEVRRHRSEIVRLHESIARTLSLPRYRAADALNRALRRVSFLHTFLKKCLVGLRRPGSSSSHSAQ
jgi:hypothetical protein